MGLGAGGPVVLESDAAPVCSGQERFGLFLPGTALGDAEVDVLRGGRMFFMAAELGPIAIQDELGVVRLFEDDRFEIEVNGIVGPAAATQVQFELFDKVALKQAGVLP